MSDVMVEWKPRGERGDTWEAWLEGEPAHGHVQGHVFSFWQGSWRYCCGLNHPSELVFAAMGDTGWRAESREAAERDCLREMKRLRRWANDQGSETIEPLEWRPSEAGGEEATLGFVSATLVRDGRTWALYLDASHGEPEEEGYLRGLAADKSDPMALGWTKHASKKAAKAFAQERAAMLVRWLGGDPDAGEAAG